MSTIALILIALIAALHVYIAWFEMFAWETRGPKIFRGFPKDLFPKTRVLAFNQGAYNAVLACGLIWSLMVKDPDWQRNIASFFLFSVAVVGCVGAFSAARQILFVQTLPAVTALALIWLT